LKDDFIKAEIEKHSQTLQQLPVIFNKNKRESDRLIDRICEEAGILDQIEKVREDLKASKAQLQSNADSLSGRVQQLKEIYEKYFACPIPEGMTHKHGIALEPLDSKTRTLILGDNFETVQALGGTLEGFGLEQEEILQEEESEEEVVEEEEELLEWNFKSHWKNKVRKALDLYKTDLEMFEKVYAAESVQIRAQIDRNLPEDFEEDSSEEDSSSEEDMTPQEIKEFIRNADKRNMTPGQRERLEQMAKEYGVED